MGAAQSTAGSSKFRALLPFFCCVLLTAIVLSWQYHRTHVRNACITFRVLLEGQPPSATFENRFKRMLGERPLYTSHITIEGSPYDSGEPCGPGFKTLSLNFPGFQPLRTNVFVWYKPTALDTINLPYLKGSLVIDVSPSENKVTVQGDRFQTQLINCGRKSLNIPVGTYEVTTRFERISLVERVTVDDVLPARVYMDPGIVKLEISSSPASSAFSLRSQKHNISVEGSAPVTLTGMPAGNYELTIWRGSYRKVVPITLTASEPTNHVNVPFEYGKVRFTSEPAEAGITTDRTRLGTTPDTLSFAPGSHEVFIEKPGYVNATLKFYVVASESREHHVELESVAFVQAMERARREISPGVRNYERAFLALREALRSKPKDTNALSLMEEIQFRLLMQTAKNLERSSNFDLALHEVNGALSIRPKDAEAVSLRSSLERAAEKAIDDAKLVAEAKKRDVERANAKAVEDAKQAAEEAAEARKNRPALEFQNLTSKTEYQELFDLQTLKYSGNVWAARHALLKALNRYPKWTIRNNSQLTHELFVVEAALPSLLGIKTVVFVGGQTTDNESIIVYKFWDLLAATPTENNGKPMKPLHPNYYSKNEAEKARGHYEANLRRLQNQLEKELR